MRVHDHSLEGERACQLRARRLQQSPSKWVEASEAELLVPDVAVGQTQRPHGPGEEPRGERRSELARDDPRGSFEARSPATNFLQRRRGVTRRFPERQHVDNRHHVGEGQTERRFRRRHLPQQLELVGAAAELEGGHRLQQVQPASSREDTRPRAPERLAEEDRGAQHRHGGPQVRHGPARTRRRFLEMWECVKVQQVIHAAAARAAASNRSRRETRNFWPSK